MRSTFPFIAVLFILSSILLPTGSARANFARPLSSGAAYPTLDDATTSNPAALVDQSGLTAGRLDYDPNGGYTGMYASASQKIGFGLALNTLGSGKVTAGAGTGTDIYHIGVNATFDGVPGKLDFGFGAMIGGLEGLRLGLGYSNEMLTLAFGYVRPSQFQFEVDLKAQPSDFTADGNHIFLSAAAIRYFSGFGVGIFENSNAGLKSPGISDMSIGGMVQFYLSGRLSVDLRYALDPNGGFGFGLMTEL